MLPFLLQFFMLTFVLPFLLPFYYVTIWCFNFCYHFLCYHFMLPFLLPFLCYHLKIPFLLPFFYVTIWCYHFCYLFYVTIRCYHFSLPFLMLPFDIAIFVTIFLCYHLMLPFWCYHFLLLFLPFFLFPENVTHSKNTAMTRQTKEFGSAILMKKQPNYQWWPLLTDLPLIYLWLKGMSNEKRGGRIWYQSVCILSVSNIAQFLASVVKLKNLDHRNET